MGREIDRRDFSRSRVSPARERELQAHASAVSDLLPGDHRIRAASFDATTGNPRVVASEAAPAEAGNYVQRAMDHLQRIKGALGLTATQPAEFVPDPHYQQTSSGAVSVHLRQHYNTRVSRSSRRLKPCASLPTVRW